jgi:hypothetical protein
MSSEPSLINPTESNLNVQPTLNPFHKTDILQEIPTTEVFQEILTPKDKSRSNSDSSSLERVSDIDISQFEMCNTEFIDDKRIPNNELISGITSAEKQSTGRGLGLLFSIIKNSIVGNDKEPCSKQTQQDTINTSEVPILKFSFIVAGPY